jgi:hypothetical protein
LSLTNTGEADPEELGNSTRTGTDKKIAVFLPMALSTNFTSWWYAPCMKRATIALPDDLEQALERFVEEQAVPVQLTAVVQAALREYQGERGYLPSASKLRIRPAERGSGKDDVSASRDRYLSST